MRIQYSIFFLSALLIRTSHAGHDLYHDRLFNCFDGEKRLISVSYNSREASQGAYIVLRKKDNGKYDNEFEGRATFADPAHGKYRWETSDGRQTFELELNGSHGRYAWLADTNLSINCQEEVPAMHMKELFGKWKGQQISDDEVIVDVRTAEEFNQYHLGGAENVSHEMILKDPFKYAERWRDKKTVYLHCRSGMRVQLVADALLREAGLKNVIYVVKSGMQTLID